MVVGNHPIFPRCSHDIPNGCFTHGEAARPATYGHGTGAGALCRPGSAAAQGWADAEAD
jgi:hypothetical protein